MGNDAVSSLAKMEVGFGLTEAASEQMCGFRFRKGTLKALKRLGRPSKEPGHRIQRWAYCTEWHLVVPVTRVT